jgi:hypothetical protein
LTSIRQSILYDFYAQNAADSAPARRFVALRLIQRPNTFQALDIAGNFEFLYKNFKDRFAGN